MRSIEREPREVLAGQGTDEEAPRQAGNRSAS
jgi:hypothetical protein